MIEYRKQYYRKQMLYRQIRQQKWMNLNQQYDRQFFVDNNDQVVYIFDINVVDVLYFDH